MTKGFKVQKISSNTNISTPPFHTLHDARKFLTTEISAYSQISNIALTTQTLDKLIWCDISTGREIVVIQTIDLSQQRNNAPQEYIEIGEKIDAFHNYLNDIIDPKKIALTYSIDYDDLSDVFIDCCNRLKELAEYVKGEV